MDGRTGIASRGDALRLFRVLQICFIVSACLFLYMVIKILPKGPKPVDPTVETLITIVALAAVVLGFVFPRYLAGIAQRASANATQAAQRLQWLARSVMGFAFIEACSLFAIVLHSLGADLRRSELLIGVGIVATVFFSPGAPPPDDRDSGQS